MEETRFSSREFNQNVAKAKRAALSGPVIVTDRGEPAFVLTTYQRHRRAAKENFVSLLDALAMPEDDIEIELPSPQYPHVIELD